MPSRIAFLDVFPADNGGFRAAVLVTDERGDPLEFRTTSVVQPTQLQKVLLGRRFGNQVYISALAVPLVDALDDAPTLIVVRHRALLELRAEVQVPVLCANTKSDAQTESANSAGAGLQTHPDHPNDLAAQALLALLGPLPGLHEVFGRIAQATALVSQGIQHEGE